MAFDGTSALAVRTQWGNMVTCASITLLPQNRNINYPTKLIVIYSNICCAVDWSGVISPKALCLGSFGKLVGSSRAEVSEEALRGFGLLHKTASGTRFHANFIKKSHMIFLGASCSKTWCLIAFGIHAVLIFCGSLNVSQRCQGRASCRSLFEARPGVPHTPEIGNFWGRPGYYVVYPGTR